VIDFSLTEEQLLLQKTAHDFAKKEIKPIAAEYDRKPDPAECIIPRDYYRKAAKLGLTKILANMGNLALVIALEELAVADCGFASTVGLINQVTGTGTSRIAKLMQEKEAADGVVIIASCMGEPDAGGTEAICTIPDPKFGIKTYARLEGDEWVINGAKHMWCSNAGIADFYNIIARTDMTKPQTEAAAAFFVPAGTPGLTLEPFHAKVGLRTVAHTSLVLDNVRVPKDYKVGKKFLAFPRILPIVACTSVGAQSVGIARAAFEYALEYAKQRVTWGKPIIEHQAVALMLADMKIDIEASRLLNWHAAWTNDQHREEPRPVYHNRGAIQKVFNTEAALRVTEKAIYILGGYGLDNALPLEKWHRDALAGPIRDVQNSIWRLEITESLYMDFPYPSLR
jgi:acyl-CoA dehydrogenase